MLIIADLHLHSKYSRATSKQMDLDGLSLGAKMKGLTLLGTGDITHPAWFNELKSKLTEIDNSGIYIYNGVYFMLSGEVATYFEFEGKNRRVHHVIHLPSFEVAEQVNEKLSKYGELSLDGRPILNISSPELVEILMEVDDKILIYPAHAWTPWMSCLGSKSGFNSLEECYQDQVNHIFSLETGLSSDPAMNWRVSKLDKFTLLSNSDAHSPSTLRLGREANVFNLKKLSYMEIYEAIKSKDRSRFLFTVETDPNYGKYHYDGHRGCGVRLSPSEAKKLNNICPKCGKPLTVGVLHRVEELADRPEGFIPENAIPFKSLLPLYEIIFFTFDGKITNKAILEEQNRLISKFSNELNVLLNVPKEELLKVTHKKIAEAIIRVREGKIRYVPGYDGVYGKPIIYSEEEKEEKMIKSEKYSKSLEEFF